MMKKKESGLKKLFFLLPLIINLTFLSSLFYISRKDLKRGKAESSDSAFAAVLMVSIFASLGAT